MEQENTPFPRFLQGIRMHCPEEWIINRQDSIRVPVLLGPTAAGKTALAVEIAEANGWEIISCDSRQVYRGMDIGTAKPDASQMARVRHWLVDLIDPGVSYSAFDFARDAGTIIRTCAERGKQAFICGGTGLYFEGLRKGIAPQTATDPLIRARLTERAEHEGHSVLHAALERVDPESARRIHVNDLQRTVRALVVYEQTGTPASEWRRRTCPPVDMVFDVAVIMPPRDELYKRIDRRVDDMATRGLYDEFLQLLRNGFDSRSPGMQCIGYRELFGIRSGAYDMATAIERIKRNTRHFARRQYTWFNAHNRTEFVSWRREKPDCRRGVAAGTDYAILANDVRQLYTYDEGKKNNTK